jgi:DNA-binding response OmpR family regulator
MNINTKKKVLIVEDDKALRNVLKDKLNNENFSVLVANDGKEGLSVAEKKKPDLILLDIIMPKMNGLEMLKKLREDRWGKTVPILLLTNDSNPEHMRETLKVDASDYLIKSDWNLEDIIKKIKETLGL